MVRATRSGVAAPAVDIAERPAAGPATTSPDLALSSRSSALAAASTSLSLTVRNVDDLQALAGVFAASGMFNRGQNPNQTLACCAVQLMAGMEAGFTPFASITGIYVVNGKPGFSAQLLAQAIRRHPLYDYRVREKTAESCSIAFFAGTEELGVETFTMDMARRAGLVGSRGPWQQYPEAMLFARCLTAGMRTHCPDALGGHTPYTPEELGGTREGEIDENGMVVRVRAQAPETPPDRDQLCVAALRVIKEAGLTAAGMRQLLDELGGPEVMGLGQLADEVLGRLVRQGISPTTVQRWNQAADAAEAVQAPAVDGAEDLPLSWDLPQEDP